MSHLPNEILLAVVALSDRKTLLNLIVVSKKFNAMALRTLYQDITLPLDGRWISMLRRDIQTNPGVQFATTFAIYLSAAFLDRGKHCAKFEHIIPYLVNVRRLCLPRQCADPGVLSLLPASAHLTHLVLDRNRCSEYLSRFFSSHPTLESITLYNSGAQGHIVEFAAGDLPKLHSLAIAFDKSVHIKSVMPSVVNLSIFSSGRVRRHVVLDFPSIRSLSLLNTDLPTVLSLPPPLLPNLEFLQVTFIASSSLPDTSDFAIFSTLKYVQFRGVLIPDALALQLFDVVQSLVVVEANDYYKTLRWIRDSESITPLEENTPDNSELIWEGWWERAREHVEEVEGMHPRQ